MKKRLIIIDVVVLMILIKVIWVLLATSGYGDKICFFLQSKK